MLRQDAVCLASSGGTWVGAAVAVANSNADAASTMGPTSNNALTAIGTAAEGQDQRPLKRPRD